MILTASRIVTGAGNGIGLSIVKQLLNSSSVAHVVGVDINGAKLEDLRKQHSGRLHIILGDVSEDSTNKEAVATAIRVGERLDSLILNAATFKPVGPLASSAISDWKAAFDINLLAPLRMVR
jgi:NAD(P)-dependent dehydrogenase (short-subunit alcohol dehydrogenase family)